MANFVQFERVEIGRSVPARREWISVNLDLIQVVSLITTDIIRFHCFANRRHIDVYGEILSNGNIVPRERKDVRKNVEA